MNKYAKTIVALLGALATWGITAGEDSVYTQAELWGGLAAVVTAVGVYFIPNREGESVSANHPAAFIEPEAVPFADTTPLPARKKAAKKAQPAKKAAKRRS